MMTYETDWAPTRRPRPYIGPDANGLPLHEGELVVYDGEIWRLGGNRIKRLSVNRSLPLIQVGTMNLRRA